MKIDNLPVFGICGWSGSGKTTLLVQLLPKLRELGINIAVVKHDAHRLNVDHPGKDSDRLFKSYADVILHSQDETLSREHKSIDDKYSDFQLQSLANKYDLILVEGHKKTPIKKIWLSKKEEKSPPDDVSNITAVLPWSANRLDPALKIITEFIKKQWLKTPAFGCVLIGGKSSRMGKPKHEIIENGESWLQRIIKNLEPVVQKIVIVGAGKIQKELIEYTRLPDAPFINGPMSGMLAAMRWAPCVSWIVAACDQPDISGSAMQWLLSQRVPGVWGIMPRIENSPGVETMPAYYDFRSQHIIEKLAFEEKFMLNKIAENSKIISPVIPNNFVAAWRNINSFSELNDELSVLSNKT